ncbi:MAG TPA: hypothetical protein DEB06_11710, partial [Phycisphaerales bacterium]|nr:hypothetical protein [Phycisphaerales bacterium]
MNAPPGAIPFGAAPPGAALLPEGGFPYKIACLCDLRDDRGRVLLLHRSREPNRGLHSPIGGKLDMPQGESPAQCAQREIHEEAGIEVPISRLRLVGLISEHGYEHRVNWLMFWYRVVGPVSVAPKVMREGSLDWHEPGALDRLPMPETDRRVIWPLVRAHEGPGDGSRSGFFAVHI